MTLYLIIALVIYGCAHLRFFHGYGPALDRGLCMLLIAAAAVASGFGHLGTDYDGYELAYRLLLESFNDSWWEPGFQLFATVAKLLGFSYDGFVALCVATTLLVAYRASRTLVFNRALFLFSLYCFELLSSAFTRQQLAASIAFLAVRYASGGRLLAFSVAAIVATSMHYSALLFLAIAFVVFFYRRIGRGTMILCGLLAAAGAPLLFNYYISTDKYLNQSALYLASDFVQGIDADSSTIRNVLKYFFYVFFGLTLTLIARQRPEAAEPTAPDPHSEINWLIIVVSMVAVSLSALISPVFARLSVFLFPLLAVMYGNAAPMRNVTSLLAYALLSVLLPVYLYFSLLPILDYY